MSTFTLQDLNLPATADQAVEAITKEKWMEYGMNNPISQSAIDYATQHAPEPQPTTEGTNVPPDLQTIINNICGQLQLLSTVISQAKAQPEGAQGNSLQETVKLVLQQGDWFEEVVKRQLELMDVESIAESCAETLVEREVESYFDHRFSPEDHFDFGDAVSDAVDDRLDDIVSDKIDYALESYMSNATITITK